MLLTEEEITILLQGLELISDTHDADDVASGRLALARQLNRKLLDCDRVRVEAKGDVTLSLES